MVQVLSHAAEASPAGRLTPELERALLFFKHRLTTAGPRKVSSRAAYTWFLFTDACLEDSKVKCIRGYSQEVSTCVCQSLNPDAKQTIISELEAVAVLAGLECLCDHLSPKCDDRLVVFIDNEAALGASLGDRPLA